MSTFEEDEEEEEEEEDLAALDLSNFAFFLVEADPSLRERTVEDIVPISPMTYAKLFGICHALNAKHKKRHMDVGTRRTILS